MELTSEQQQQLQQLKDMGELQQQLQTKSENFQSKFETLITEKSKSLSERKMVMEHIKSLQEELEKAKKIENDNERKLEEAKKLFVHNNNDYLQSIYLLLGYGISNFQLLENNELQITLRYRDICYVTYREKSQVFDLIELYPHHNNFPYIKEFLHRSQDFRGLLSGLRKFFDFALACKDKQEQLNKN